MSSWRKPASSLANGACVEAASWRKASGSVNHGACTEVACGGGVVRGPRQ